MLRDGQPIKDVGVVGSIDPHITYNQSFAEWDAVVGCGGTLSDLWRWDHGGFPDRYWRAKVISFHQLKQQITLHVEDAKARAIKRKSRKN